MSDHTTHPGKTTNLLLALTAALSLAAPVHAELTLSGSPSSQDQIELDKRYIKLAAQLTETLGEPVRYVAPINEIGYAQDIRKGRYDILLDGPHLAAWRIAKGLHKPVVQSDVPLTFLIVAPASNKSIHSPEQLIGKHVCVQPSPNLSNMMFMSLYPNPLQLPSVRVTEGYNPIAQKVLTGECSAGVLTTTFYENTLDKDAQNQLRVIYNTRPLPGHVLTVSNKMSDTKREALQKRLTGADPATDKLAQAMTTAGVRGGEPSKTHWQVVKSESIKGLDKLLTQQSFGWE